MFTSHILEVTKVEARNEFGRNWCEKVDCLKTFHFYGMRKSMEQKLKKTHGADSFLEKLTGPQIVKFTTFYGARRFITVFTRTRHLSLS